MAARTLSVPLDFDGREEVGGGRGSGLLLPGGVFVFKKKEKKNKTRHNEVYRKHKPLVKEGSMS